MIESYYVGIYWGKRKEPTHECAQRVSHLLDCISRCDPVFGRWFEKGKTLDEALRSELCPSVETLETLLARGVNRGDFSGKPLDDLGFRLDLWTGGKDGEAATLSVKCGCYTKAPILNSCVIGLPFSGPIAKQILKTPVLSAILQCMALSWDPDWGVVMSRLFQAGEASASAASPRVGWISYFSRRRGVPRNLGPQFRQIDISGLGSLVMTTEEQFTARNRTHVELANNLAGRLRQEGLLDQIVL